MTSPKVGLGMHVRAVVLRQKDRQVRKTTLSLAQENLTQVENGGDGLSGFATAYVGASLEPV